MKKILILGGSGFIGRAVAEALTKRGHTVTVPTRQRARARHLLLLPTVDVIEADVRNPATLRELTSGHDVVINLVGILSGDFVALHVNFPKQVAETCVQCGVARLIQMSALNAETTAPSAYLQSRGRGEHALWSVAKAHPGLNVTVFRPSVVFGADDNFLNLLHRVVRLSPVIPLGSPCAQFQPVWVEDVARAIALSIDLQQAAGATFTLVGPQVYTMRELLDLVMQISGQQRVVIELGEALSKAQALAFEFPPMKWLGAALNIALTRDNLRSMSIANTSNEPFPAVFGAPAALEATLRSYLSGDTGRLRYQQLRHRAGR